MSNWLPFSGGNFSVIKLFIAPTENFALLFPTFTAPQFLSTYKLRLHYVNQIELDSLVEGKCFHHLANGPIILCQHISKLLNVPRQNESRNRRIIPFFHYPFFPPLNCVKMVASRFLRSDKVTDFCLFVRFYLHTMQHFRSMFCLLDNFDGEGHLEQIRHRILSQHSLEKWFVHPAKNHSLEQEAAHSQRLQR